MVNTVTVTDLQQAGRARIAEAPVENVAYSYNADFSAPTSIELDFTIINQSAIFGIVKSLFVDNGTSPSPVDVIVSITGQRFTIPAYAIGFFPINAAIQSKITLNTDGGADKITTVTVFNYDIPGNVWYSYGTINFNTVLPSQGTMAEGTVVSSAPNNNPLYIAGIDRGTGELRAVSVDATGRVNIDDSTPIDVNITGTPIDVIIANTSVSVNIDNVPEVNEQGSSFSNITTAGTAVVSGAAAVLQKININTVAVGTITIYDNTVASGAIIGTITLTVTDSVKSIDFNIACGTGITIVTSVAMDLTVTYR